MPAAKGEQSLEEVAADDEMLGSGIIYRIMPSYSRAEKYIATQLLDFHFETVSVSVSVVSVLRFKLKTQK